MRRALCINSAVAVALGGCAARLGVKGGRGDAVGAARSAMALFDDCWARRRSTLDRLKQLLADAEASAQRERRAAVNIQRLFRGQRVRAAVSDQTRAEIVLARVYRGHLGRKRFIAAHRERMRAHRLSILNYYATVIQKRMRGAISRTRRLDFRERKAQITRLAEKGEEMRRLLAENLRRQQLDEERSVRETAQKELVEVTQDLHHLVSTRAIPGVYNSPALPSSATAFGVPVETHIRINARAAVGRKLASTAPPTKLAPYPPSNKATIQSTSEYSTELRAVRTQRRYDKLRRLSGTDFQAVANPEKDVAKRLLNVPGINAGVQYLDEWENPYKKRGVPRTREDLLPKLTTLDKAPKNPFYLTHGGNKSKVHANDRFDL